MKSDLSTPVHKSGLSSPPFLFLDCPQSTPRLIRCLDLQHVDLATSSNVQDSGHHRFRHRNMTDAVFGQSSPFGNQLDRHCAQPFPISGRPPVFPCLRLHSSRPLSTS